MEIRGAKTALAEAVADARQQELRELPVQLALFDQPALEHQPIANGHEANGHDTLARRGPGRPPGARNRRTDEAARIYMAEFGDPLRRAVAISAMPILAPGVLPELAKVLGCDRITAAKWWTSTLAATLPFIHQRLATLEIKPAGSPEGGEPVRWEFSDGEQLAAEIVAVTAPDEPEETC
jgi:hypothetical protein